MVVDHARDVNRSLKEPITFMIVELVFQCFHEYNYIIPSSVRQLKKPS
jgi:hypothetical protein